MARIVYSNSKNPKKMYKISIPLCCIAICFLLFFVVLMIVNSSSQKISINETLLISLQIFSFVFYFFSFFFIQRLSNYIVIDEEEDKVEYAYEKYSMKISDLEYVAYKTTKKGRYIRLMVHAEGHKFFEVGLNKSKADEAVAHLKRLNPKIEIRNINFF